MMDDKAALEDIRNGGQAGVQAIRARYQPRLRIYAEKYLPKKQVEPVVQSVLARFEKNVDKLNERELSAWLYQITDFAIDGVALKYIHQGEERSKKELGCTILYKHYVTSVLGDLIAKHHIPHKDVEVLLEDVIFKLCKSIDNFRQECSVLTFLYWHIIPSIVNDYRRKHRRDDLITPLGDEAEVQSDENDGEERFFKKRCLEQVKALLEREGNTGLLSCLEARLWRQQGLSVREISEKIGRNYDATTTFLCDCRQRLAQYPPLQECHDIFLKMCLEDAKAKLDRQGSNDDDILTCLQAMILKLQGKSIGEVAEQIGKTSRETTAYLSDCQQKLMQHPAIEKECQEWLEYLK